MDALGGAVDITVEQLTTLQNESALGGMHKVRGSAHYTRYEFYKGLRNSLRELIEEELVQTLEQMQGGIAQGLNPLRRSHQRSMRRASHRTRCQLTRMEPAVRIPLRSDSLVMAAPWNRKTLSEVLSTASWSR
jgi:hypothetical protein